MGKQILSSYDSRPISACIAVHAESMDAVLVPAGEAQLCVLAFTAADARYEADRGILQARLQENFQNGTPTVLLDLSRGQAGSMEQLLAALAGGRVVTALSPYQEGTVGTLSIQDFTFPWYRTFEIDFSSDIGTRQAELPPALLFA